MSEKSKRKGQPQRKGVKLIGAIVAFVLLIVVAFILNWQSHSNIEPLTPDYAATATQIIESATQTAVFLEEEGCEIGEVTRWRVDIFFDTNNEIDFQESEGNNETVGTGWFCNGIYIYEHTEYYINVFIETEDTKFVSLIDDIVLFLESYPSDDIPELPPIIDLSIIQPSTNMIPVASFRINYDDLIEAFDSGLSGAELLEAVATPIE